MSLKSTPYRHSPKMPTQLELKNWITIRKCVTSLIPERKNMNKEQLKNELIESKVNTFEYVVASLRMNKPIKYLIKKLDTLNYVINYRLNRYSLKKNSKFPRVEFYCFNQYARNNTHSHIYLKVPSCVVVWQTWTQR